MWLLNKTKSESKQSESLHHPIKTSPVYYNLRNNKIKSESKQYESLHHPIKTSPVCYNLLEITKSKVKVNNMSHYIIQ